ncbi:Serine protease family s33, partial [Globisporangium splendens]
MHNLSNNILSLARRSNRSIPIPITQVKAAQSTAHAERFQFFVDDTNDFVTFAQDSIFPQTTSGANTPRGVHLPLILAGASFGTLVALHTSLAVKSEFTCRDPAFVVDFMNDPLTVGEHMTLRACVALQKAPEVVDSTSTFRQMLFMMGSVDHVTSLSLAVECFAKMQDKNEQFKVFDGLYHALFDDLEKNLVFEFLLDWLHARFPEPMIVHSGSA